MLLKDTSLPRKKRGLKISAAALAALTMFTGLNVSAAHANSGGAGGAAGTGTGSSGAWQLYNMQYDEFNQSVPLQGTMSASTEWFINNYQGPNWNGSGGTGAQDAVRQACTSALAKAETRGGNQGKSRVVAAIWAGSSTNAWQGGSSASSSFFTQRFNEVIAAGFPGIYSGAAPFIQAYFPEGVAEAGFTPSAVCVALNQNEPQQFTFDPPVKSLTTSSGSALANDNVLASGQMYVAKIAAPANGRTGEMSIWDTIGTNSVWIGSTTADDKSRVQVLDPAGNVVPNAAISITRTGTQTIVQGSVNVPDAHARGIYTLLVPTYVLPTGADYDVPDSSHVTYNGNNRLDGNNETTRKVTPQPDKVWVLDENGALTTADPNRTNQEGADGMVFLPGDTVSAVVNGTIKAKMPDNLTKYQIIDDWTKAAQYVDFTDPSKVNVFYEVSSGAGKYDNVTDQFNIDISGTVTTATAKDSFLSRTNNLAGNRTVKLVISGEFRSDYDTDGATVVLHNDGAEVWNNEKVNTNTPPVYTWTPNPNKEVLGSGEEAGDNGFGNISGMSVWPGQKLEYSIGLDLRVPGNTAHTIESFGVEDVYDPQFTPDKSSVEFWDSRDATNAKPIARSAYNLVFDDEANKFTATFKKSWIDANLNDQGNWDATPGWLSVRFTGTVKPTAAPGSTIENQAFQLMNDSRTATEIPEVNIPSVNPDKEDLDTNNVDIDGKTVMLGDTIRYRLTLDAGPSSSELAYYVHKLGMIDDYDEEYLEANADNIRVYEAGSGIDVTAAFNVQLSDGKFAVFAKQVDYTNAFGELIQGEPQPADLFAYDQEPISPHTTPIIDQGLLGKKYHIVADMLVIKEQKDYVIENQARQNIQNTHQHTRIVSNPLTAINPEKDVVIEAGTDDTINGTEVELNAVFNYRLQSSTIPADRAYNASQWSITDTFDRTHDAFTGMWAIYAATDVFDGENLVFKQGDLIQESENPGEYFTVVFDEETYTLTATANQAYFDLVNTRNDLPQAWAIYTKMERVSAGEKIVNTHTESYNNISRESNEVWTHTPAPKTEVPPTDPPAEPKDTPLAITGGMSTIGLGVAAVVMLLIAAGIFAVTKVRKRNEPSFSVDENI